MWEHKEITSAIGIVAVASATSIKMQLIVSMAIPCPVPTYASTKLVANASVSNAIVVGVANGSPAKGRSPDGLA